MANLRRVENPRWGNKLGSGDEEPLLENVCVTRQQYLYSSSSTNRGHTLYTLLDRLQSLITTVSKYPAPNKEGVSQIANQPTERYVCFRKPPATRLIFIFPKKRLFPPFSAHSETRAPLAALQ